MRSLDALAAELDGNSLHDAVEVIVVDDGSNEGVRVQVRECLGRRWRGMVRYIEQPQNGGAAAARNAGAAASRGAVIAFLDDDIVPAPGFAAAWIGFHERHPRALIACGDLQTMHNDAYGGFWAHEYGGVFQRPGPVPYTVAMLSSGHFCIKRELLQIETSLFDESLTAREDFDLYLRLKKRGINVYKADGVLAVVECRRSLSAFFKQHAWYGRGQEQLERKYGRDLLIREASERQPTPPNWRYAHLYLVARIARWTQRQSRPSVERQTP